MLESGHRVFHDAFREPGSQGENMKISAARSFLLKVPIGKLIADSMQQVTDLEFAGIIIRTECGLEGTGYTVTVGHGGEVIRSVIDTLFIENLIGQNPQHVREIWQKLYYGRSHWIGRAGATTMAQAAVDIALWDILAKSAKLPLWRLLGGARSADVPIYNTHAGWLNYSLDQLKEEIRSLLDQGYRAIKMKVGGPSMAEDVKRVSAIRQFLADDILLMIDANQKWDLEQARLAFRSMEGLALSWIEEPLHPDDIAGHAELHSRANLPVALGEHVYTTHAFRDYIDRPAVDIVQVDVCRVGGITPWLQVAAMAEAANLRVCPHAGDVMQVHQHLVKVIPNHWLLEVIPIWENSPFRHPIQLRDGFCRSPETPGADTEFTPEAFERFSVRQ
ncbi:MAG: mandelate racemase/muconate lactonizing enzyme family protein [Steroidobacteraceae bacterium]